MTRVTIIVEGPTEERFIKDVLAPSLWCANIHPTPIIIGAAGHKGGNVNYARLRKDVLLQLKQDRTAFCSSMLDLYRLGSGFPGTPCSENLTGSQKAERIEAAVLEDIITHAPDLRPDRRLIPYLQVYEFEALLFSDATALSDALGQPALRLKFAAVRGTVSTPEDINEGPNTAPSKQILRLHPGYQKVIGGTQAARRVGIEKMRLECPHFHAWVSRLELLATSR